MSAGFRAAATLALVWCAATPLAAQTNRAELIRAGADAASNAQPRQALQWLGAAVNPALGPFDSLWTLGVQTIVDVLIDRDTLASVWARWAVRQVPGFRVDSIRFTPETVSAFERARAFVGTERQRVETTFRWPASMDIAAQGRISTSGGQVPVRLLIVGKGLVQPGESRELPAGSYQLRATAEGYLPVDITREVLPGVETILSFRMMPEAAGYLYVATQPWSQVFVDGERIGPTTVVALRVGAGSHRLRLVRDGYAPVDTTVVVARDARVRITRRLEPRRP